MSFLVISIRSFYNSPPSPSSKVFQLSTNPFTHFVISSRFANQLKQKQSAAESDFDFTENPN